LSRASIVRTLSTPARRKQSQIALKSRVPAPLSRPRWRTWMAKIQPQGGEPNSQARISPITKPSMPSALSATRKKRSFRRRDP